MPTASNVVSGAFRLFAGIAKSYHIVVS